MNRTAIAGCAFLIATLLVGCGEAPEKAPEEATKTAEVPAKPSPTPEKEPVRKQPEKPSGKPAGKKNILSKDPRLDPQRLVGQWLRPDGGYVIKITHVASDGKVEASYHNPRPIRVESASASNDTGKLVLRVKLNDRGYPGCIYELVYDRESDTLIGTYFQAAMQQTYQIGF